MALVRNPTNGEIGIIDDPTGLLEQGWQIATPEEAEAEARRLDFSTPGQQLQAQGERVVRGATLGLVEGFSGSDADIRAREEVSRQESPVTSFLGDVAPDVALAAATGGLGAAAGLGRVGALAAESVATGLVGSSQQAFAEGRTAWEDIGRDAENALIWGGLNFGLGGVMLARAGKPSAKATAEAVEQVDDWAAAAEAKHLDEIPDQAVAGDVATAVDPDPVIPPQGPIATKVEVVNDGVIDAATPEQIAGWEAEMREISDTALADKSLKDLKALELGPDDRAGIDGIKGRADFQASGNVTDDNFGSSPGGLPRINIYDGPDGGVYLNNGRHRLTAAREMGRETIIARVTKMDEDGHLIWDAEMPVRVSAPPKAAAGAVREAEKEAVDDGLSRAVRRASKTEADDIVRRAVKEAPEKEADSFGRQRRLYQNREAIIDVATTEMQRDLTKVVKDVGELTRNGKVADVAKNVSENTSAQRSVAKSIAQDAAKFAGELRAEAKAYGAASGAKGLQYAAKGTKDLTLSLMDHAKQIQEATTGKAMFEAIDEFKRVLQSHKLGLEQGATVAANPLPYQNLIPKVQDFAAKLRTNLENASTWGKAGDMQAAYNAVIHDRLLPSMRIFEESVLKRTHKGYDAIWETEGWESKIKALFKDADSGKRRHVGAVLDAMAELASVNGKFGGAKSNAITDAVDKIRRTMGLADEVADATERMQAVGAIAGMIPGAPKQWLMGDLASNFRRLTGATDAAVGRGVDDWIRSSRVRGGGLLSKLPNVVSMSDDAMDLKSVAQRRGVSHAMAAFMGDDENATAAFEKKRDALMSDETFMDAIGRDYKALQQDAPEAYMMVAARAAQARNLLLERMPPNVSVSMMRPNGYPPSRESVEDWAIYWNTIQDPVNVVRNLPAVRPQELETIKSIYPRLYEQVQRTVLEKIGQANASGEPLDDTFLMRMDLLFGLDGAGSTAFSQKATQLALEHNQRMADQQSGGGPSKPPPNRPGPVQSTAANGATFGSGF